ncbi:TolC family protein [Marinifilum flexuosum]|uniref:TolC family protein n=1 Tax=Marinifilum flexuosum TaxID=1117708 RepID=UPI00249534C8|nr:TolC family protein [Marinifilum flexuosum]
MRGYITRILFSLLIMSLSIISNAQVSEVIDKELKLHNLKTKIIPLGQLLDSAVIHSPLLKMIDADILIQDLKIKSEKKDWLSYFSVTGSAKYGMFDNLIINESLGDESTGTTNAKQQRYSVGLSLKIPFSSIFDNVDREVAISEKVKLQYQKDKVVSELRKLVVTQYGNLLRAHAKLIIKTSELETMKMQMADTEVNYRNGKIPLADYSKQKSQLLNLRLECEEIRIEFTVAIHLLQETIGIKLNLN